MLSPLSQTADSSGTTATYPNTNTAKSHDLGANGGAVDDVYKRASFFAGLAMETKHVTTLLSPTLTRPKPSASTASSRRDSGNSSIAGSYALSDGESNYELAARVDLGRRDSTYADATPASSGDHNGQSSNNPYALFNHHEQQALTERRRGSTTSQV